MFNNVALDVFIGLTFVFLLYSLLASVIKEMIATIFCYRGRMLEKGLEQMLDGKHYSYYWWDKVRNFFLWIWYKMITNVTTSKIEKQALHRDAFFRKKVINEATASKQIHPKAVVRNKVTSPQYIYRAKLNKKAALFSANITAHPFYKRAAENNALFKKPAYLGPTTFSDILMDILGRNRTATVLMKDISAYIETDLADRVELQRILRTFAGQANGDVQRFKMLLEQWYNDTMDRVSGWYRRQVGWILLIIGIGIAIVFNVDAIKIYSTLSTNKTAREQMVSIAIQSRGQLGSDSLLKDANKKINEDMEKSGQILGLGWQHKGKFPEYKTDWTALSVVGWLITAIAISMGAPFWFDLLNKFINLRVSGPKPDDTAGKTNDSKTATLNQRPEPGSFA